MTLSERSVASRASAVLLLGLVIAAIWLGPISAYLELLSSGAAKIERQGMLLRRYQALLTSPAPTAAPTSAAGQDSGLLLPAAADAQAFAVLQELVKNAAAQAKVQIQGMQVLPSETLPGAERLTVQVRATGDIAGLAHLLREIEAKRPLLLPDRLQVQARPGSPNSAQGALQFQLDVSGFKPAASS